MMKNISLIICVISVAMGCSTAQPTYYNTKDKKAKKFMIAADACMKVTPTNKRPDLDCAIYNVEGAVERDPEFVEGYIKLGELYERNGDNRKAIESNKKALKIDPYFSKTGLIHYYTASKIVILQ